MTGCDINTTRGFDCTPDGANAAADPGESITRPGNIARVDRRRTADSNPTRPQGTSTPTDKEIHTRIQADLRRQANIAAIDLTLVVSKGVVFIDGFVKTWRERKRIQRIAADQPGVKGLHNKLIVVPSYACDNAVSSP
jgi:hypothetical protein